MLPLFRRSDKADGLMVPLQRHLDEHVGGDACSLSLLWQHTESLAPFRRLASTDSHDAVSS